MSEEQIKQELTPIQLSLYTIQLVDLLKAGKPGDVLTDEALTQACGRNCSAGGDGYGNLASAIRIVRRRHRLVWQRIRQAGAIKCTVAKEIMSVADSSRKSIERKARVTCDKLACADVSQLDDGGKRQINMQMAQLGSLALLSSTKATKKLEARGVQNPITERELLEVFK